jgi:hypothetical protein
MERHAVVGNLKLEQILGADAWAGVRPLEYNSARSLLELGQLQSRHLATINQRCCSIRPEVGFGARGATR